MKTHVSSKRRPLLLCVIALVLAPVVCIAAEPAKLDHYDVSQRALPTYSEEFFQGRAVLVLSEPLRARFQVAFGNEVTLRTAGVSWPSDLSSHRFPPT